MKKKIAVFLCFCLLCILTMACGNAKEEVKTQEDTKDQNLITVGFSQLGAESDWRSANTKSMKEAFTEENGYRLLFEDGQQKQSNQIMAIRTFIQQEVDYIVLAPVTETGWDTVLQEAKDAGIPVIIVDRMVDTKDESLFTCWVGSDFELEGRKAAEWLKQYLEKNNVSPEEVNILDIQGNLGATAQIGRTAGIEEAAKENGWNLLAQIPADFTQAKGKEVMESCLKTYKNINVVYCENDNEAFGAIEAIEEAGKTVGSNLAEGEIMIISFDGVNNAALKGVLKNQISCIAECNPLHGPRVSGIIQALEKGTEPAKFSYVSEELYVHDDTIGEVKVDGETYETTLMTNSVVLDKANEFGN